MRWTVRWTVEEAEGGGREGAGREGVWAGRRQEGRQAGLKGLVRQGECRNVAAWLWGEVGRACALVRLARQGGQQGTAGADGARRL